MLAEFLIWTQVVSYWHADLGMPLESATHLYIIIGVVGIFSMPIMGIVAAFKIGVKRWTGRHVPCPWEDGMMEGRGAFVCRTQVQYGKTDKMGPSWSPSPAAASI